VPTAPHPPTERPRRLLLHAVSVEKSCAHSENATREARASLERRHLGEVVLEGCGIVPAREATDEAERRGAAAVVMADVLAVNMEGTQGGFRAVGEVRVVALHDGQVVVNIVYPLTSRLLPDNDEARGAAELSTLAFARIGGALSAALR
jgi:hypothetical protein